MDESSITQNRRSRRSHLLMAATVEQYGVMTPVTLRNLSADGALIEGDIRPVAGAHIVFRKGELAVAGRVAWAEGRRAGIAFAMSLDPETVLRHVPEPANRPEQIQKKRPGFRRGLSEAERRLGESVWGRPLPSIEE